MSYLEGEYLQTNLPRCYCWRYEWRIPAAISRPEVRSRLDKGIDLPETLSNLTGKRIRRIKPDSVEFEDGTVIDLTKHDFEFFKMINPMIRW